MEGQGKDQKCGKCGARETQRGKEIKTFGMLCLLLLWLLQAHSGGLEENSDGWRFLLKAVMEAMRAGGGLEELMVGTSQKRHVSVSSGEDTAVIEQKW